MAKFGTKNDLFGYFWTKNFLNLFGYFWAGIPKKLLSYLKLASLDLSCCKVCCKIKILKFETKNACIFEIEFENDFVMFETEKLEFV